MFASAQRVGVIRRRRCDPSCLRVLYSGCAFLCCICRCCRHLSLPNAIQVLDTGVRHIAHYLPNPG